ncbi:FAD-dependent oxidoreductase [Roseinatronobacter alkalisoli]|uniref:FAD-dependent oxidoreductase n=1 Tax=Roseinatronobacter alkalisoli TaxID=3028235 RepID=A0ABT5TCT6_9RHOB|nr:FAD-dependent oxidoreductase [Roseinatronobacter sp. HJB301]MDD7972166.1 FAD-dependent oxidoreductase [Roseinatronobacter sp. HJB301]
MMLQTDIAVIGAGPAGANAALAAARQGFSVMLLDEQPLPGGQVWRAKSTAILDAPATPEGDAGDRLRQSVKRSSVTYAGDARVWQIEPVEGAWQLHMLKGGRTAPLRARALVIATGAREFVQPVPGWTTPGVLGLAGATALFKQELALPGKRIIVSGTGPLVFYVAAEIRRLGGEVAAVVTPNSQGDWLRVLPAMLPRPDLLMRGARWIADLMASGVPIHWRHAVTRVEGGSRVRGVGFRKLAPDWSPIGTSQGLEGDSLCLGNGLIPAVEAAQLAGVALAYHPELGGWVPRHDEDGATDVPGVFICGDSAGIRGAAAAEIHGRLAGLCAAQHLGADTRKERKQLRPIHARAARFGTTMTALSIPRAGLAQLTTEETVICRCESLTRSAIAAEIAGGARSSNAVKSGLRAGMGACGGKFCQTTVARMIAAADGRAEADVPPPTPRPPLRPVPVSVLAGDFEYSDLPIPKPAPL